MYCLLLLFLTCLFTAKQIHAQSPPGIEWQKTYGGTRRDEANSIQQTSDGGYIIAGFTESNDGDVKGLHGLTRNADYWIVKLNKQGIIQWQKTCGGSETDKANAVCQTSDGGYIIAGFTESKDEDISKSNGQQDYWIVKLSSNGSIQWQKTYGGSFVDEAKDIKQTTDGGYIVAGLTNSADGDVTRKGIYDRSSGYWVLKLSALGKIEWQKTYGGSETDEATAIRQTTDGGYIVAGYTASMDGDVTAKRTGQFWIVKTNPSGVIQWQKTYGGFGNNGPNAIQQTVDGGYVIAGITTFGGQDVTGHHGNNYNSDFWIVKINEQGAIEWQKALGGSKDDFATSVKQTTDGGYIIAGSSRSNDGDVSGNLSTSTNDFRKEIYHCWLVKLSGSGSIQWGRTYGGNEENYAKSVLQTNDGGFIVCGHTNYNSSNNGFADDPRILNENTVRGENDFFLTKITGPGSKTTLPILLTGKVLNKKTGKPVPVNIHYFDNKTNKYLGTIVADDEKTGEYKLSIASGANYDVQINKTGYFTFRFIPDATTATKNGILEYDILLVPVEIGQTVRLNNIFFDVNKSDLKSESSDELDRLVDFMQTNKSVEIEISGHTDNQGLNENNMALSQQRVESVLNYLVQKGVAKRRLKAKGYGSSKPVATNDTEEGRAKNRRVEFTVLKQ